VVVVVAGLGIGLWHSQRTLQSEQALLGAYSGEVLRLQALWEQTPCNIAAGERLADLLLEAGLAKQAASVAEQLVTQCPPTEAGLTRLYVAQRRLSDNGSAERTAGRMISMAPYRPEGYALRGLAREARGLLEAAADDFSYALELGPRLLDVPVNLANVLERMGRPCEAAKPLEDALTYYPSLDNRFELERRVERLRAAGSCPKAVAGGSGVKVPFDRSEEVILVNGVVNGTHSARFVLDTGASSVVLSRALADKLGVAPPSLATRVHVQTAGGVVDAYPARLDALDVEGARVHDLPVLVCDTMGQDVDGLLGISFLSRFNVGIDHNAGVVMFNRAAPAAGGEPSEAGITASAIARTAAAR
jgi:aspartyl protease family protein